MIDALGTPQIADPAKRLFLKANEVTGDPALAASYLSDVGWQTLESYLRTPALPDTAKISGDWVNEIHLTRQGYEKVADGWVADIGTVLA